MTPFIVKFESTKTPGIINEIAISTIEQLVSAALVLNSPIEMRELRNKLKDLEARAAKAENALLFKTPVLERNSFEDLQRIMKPGGK